ncbi:MAG: DUF1588 domain-containing protein, partial [Polyangiales bacterium]
YAANLSFNAANFTPYTRWVEALVDKVRQNPAGVINCDATAAASCLDAQARKLVGQAFRGAASTTVLDRFATYFTSSASANGLAEATAELVDLTLTSPHYVFRDEVNVNGVLSPAQQLQNLSYTLADAPPEALGLASEQAGTQLSSPAAVQQTIGAILKSPAARDKLLRFFIAWLEVKEPAELVIAKDLFPEFTDEVANAAVADTREFLRQQLTAAAPKLTAITQSTDAFVSDALAEVYGLRRVSATGLTAVDPKQRLGIFTQPGVIASHSGPTTTRLVKRGVFFTRKVMCLPLGNPPQGIDTTLPVNEDASERQRVESATASATCQGCHAMINPFGFMQENYDVTGRWRTTDNGHPIDSSIKLANILDEGPLETRSPVDALRGITSSLRFQQCFTRQLFRFYMGRDEEKNDDPVLREMFFQFADAAGAQDIVGMLQTLARSASFSQRSETP